MNEMTKAEYYAAKGVLKVGILRKHEQWQQELRELLDRPFDEEIGNAFDRSWLITKKSRDWFKELNRMEQWYRKECILWCIRCLLEDGTLCNADLTPLPDHIRTFLMHE